MSLNADQRQLLIDYSDQFTGKNFVDHRIVGGNNDFDTRFNANFLQLSFVYIITETVGDYPYPYFTEKTWRGINTGCPFMMVNACNSLAKLQEFGFKTFSNWWDESYDTKISVADRIESAIKVLSDLCLRPLSDLEKMRIEMEPVIKHNQLHLQEFQKLDLQNIADLI